MVFYNNTIGLLYSLHKYHTRFFFFFISPQFRSLAESEIGIYFGGVFIKNKYNIYMIHIMYIMRYINLEPEK